MKSILIFSNGEKIGDGIIKLPLLNEIKKRLVDFKIFWMTNENATVYNSLLKKISSNYIDEIYEKANLNLFFWKNISSKYNLENKYFDYIFDTQKSVFRTLALKRIKHTNFISGSANGIFSSIKVKKKITNRRKYYLENLYDLLDLIVKDKVDDNFKIPINNELENRISKFFDNRKKYVGIAPGAGEKNKIWPINKFIEVANYCEKNNCEIIFFLGPSENNLKNLLKKKFSNSIFIEDHKLFAKFSNIEIIMASTKFLKLAIANDSGVSHMLSTNYCPLIKLFGPKDSMKFTPLKNNLMTISAREFNSSIIDDIPVSSVISKIKEFLN